MEDEYSEKFDSEEEQLEKVIQKPNLKIEWKDEDKARPIIRDEEDKARPILREEAKDLSENKLEYQDNLQ